MQRTGAAGTVSVVRTVAERGSGRERHYVMRRRLFNFVTAVSLAVCVAALSLWIRGAVGPVRYERRAWDASALTFQNDSVSLYGGVVRVGVIHQQLNAPPSSSVLARIIRPSPWTRFAPPATAAVNSRVKNDFLLYRFGSDGRQWALKFRLWPVAVLAAVMPGVWVGRKIRTARRGRMGHCLSCGYDLRATPDRCPECGAVAGTAPAAAA